MDLHIPIPIPIPLLFLGCLYGTTDSLTYLFFFLSSSTLHYSKKTRRSLQTSKGLGVLNLLYCIQSKGQIRSPGCENEEKNKGPVRVPQWEFTYVATVGPSFYHKVLSREENYDGDGIEVRSGNGRE